MKINDAKKILMDNRPDRPKKSENRRLQKAIDVVVAYIEEGEKNERSTEEE